MASLIPDEELIPWKRVKRWECVRCGKCCRTLDVSLGFEEEELFKNFVVYGKIGVYLKRINGRCIFYSEKNRECTVYPIRPRACRLYPFYVRKAVRKAERCDESHEAEYCGVYVFLHRECSGLGKGRPLEELLPKIISEALGDRDLGVGEKGTTQETSVFQDLCSESPSRHSGRASCRFSARAQAWQSSLQNR